MLCLVDPSNSLNAVLAGAVATAQPRYAVTYREGKSLVQGTGAMTGTTAVDIVAAPTSVERIVESLILYNTDTAAVTVTVKRGSGTLFKVALAAGATLTYDENGLKVTDSTGAVAESTASIEGAGAAAGTGVVASEYGNSFLHKTVLQLTDVEIPLVDEAGVVAYGGLKVYDFPAGQIHIVGATLACALTKSSAGVNATWDGDIGVGSVTATNDGTLGTTEQNIIATTATPQAVSGATTGNAISGASSNVVLNGTSTAVDVYLNVLVDDADHDVTGTACNLIVNGTLTLLWVNSGDV